MHTPELHKPVTDDALAEAFILSLVRDDPRPYASKALQGVRMLLNALGDPHLELCCVHIAGSKGKGSVALMCEALFEAHDIRTATFSSPHLRRWNERLRIGGRDIPSEIFIQALERIRGILVRIEANSPDDLPSFFDVLCAAALLVFREAEVDLAIIECGLGGRYDATNIITPRICCITSIELEHVDKLGINIASIASHKAGIIKPHTPVVCGPLPAQALSVVQHQAQQSLAPLYQYGCDFMISSSPRASAVQTGQQCLRYTSASTPDIEFTLNCHGQHMAENAALALTVLHQLSLLNCPAGPFDLDNTRIVECLAGLKLPGRGQILTQDPYILVDTAHTPNSLNLLDKHLDDLDAGERKFLISATRGKDLQALGRLLISASEVFITCVDPMRSMPASELASGLAHYQPQLAITVIEDPEAALDCAREGLTEGQILCICGSVYLAGFALEHIEP